jgi:REP element-mobilizing transposase RayT
MPAYARCQIVEPAAVGIYHCINRCVRRAFLCGQDPLTGRSFEHRRAWIRQRLETLAGLFAVDVLGFTVMANHLHLVLRIRPDVADRWDGDTIARRWWQLFPQRRDEHGEPAMPEPHELRAVMADPFLLAERRRRLASLSWFMRCLSEPIARRANREDGCTGRFWEGRFKSQALLDEAALLACSIYVDLNPIRAGIAATPEASQFTGAFERIAARQAERADAVSDVPPHGTDLPSHPLTARRDGWLSPIPLAGLALPGDDPKNTEGSSSVFPRRASERGFLPLLLDDYLQLLDWTGRQLRRDKSGAIPARLAPILQRLHVSAEHWSDTVAQFGRWFHRAVGSAASLRRFAERRGRRWLHGLSRSRLAFGQ